jgi:catechol 2,3-dioxygenase-like lactoylglutathione lyase family enzyme
MGIAMANVNFTGIHHIKLPVSDLARSREWYERVLAYTVEREFLDDDGVVRGVGGRLPGAGVPVALRQNARVAAGNAGFDPVSFAIADRAAAEAWIAHFDALGVRHSGIRSATRGWVVDVYDPDGLTIRLYSTGDGAEDHTNQPGYAHTVGWRQSGRT